MNCSAPPPLTPDQLSAAIDGEAPTDVLEHLARCAYCEARLAEARSIEQRLSRKLHRWDCPSAPTLVAFHLGVLDEAAARATEVHTASCARCQEELADLRAFLNQPAVAPAEPAPRPPSRPARSWLQEIVAQLMPQAPAMALRGEGKAPFMAQAGEVVIVLDVQAAGEARGQPTFTLTGQLAAPEPEQWTGALVLLRRAGEIVQTAVVDDLGSFELQVVGVGALAVRITPPAGAAIVLPEVTIGERGEWTLTAS